MKSPVLRAGSKGNERLTAILAILLLITLFVVGLTVPLAQSQTRLHVILGTLVIPPILAKVASTVWRIIKYYSGDADYVEKGPPFILLRLLGPILVVLTVVMVFSGLGLVVWAPRSMYSQLWFLHRASFVLWFKSSLGDAVLASLRSRRSGSDRTLRPQWWLFLWKLALTDGRWMP